MAINEEIRERFDAIDDNLKDIYNVLKGSNGSTIGLCERVRNLEKLTGRFAKCFCWIGGILIGGWLLTRIGPLVDWLKNVL